VSSSSDKSYYYLDMFHAMLNSGSNGLGQCPHLLIPSFFHIKKKKKTPWIEIHI
jgi:hypothetical protein